MQHSFLLKKIKIYGFLSRKKGIQKDEPLSASKTDKSRHLKQSQKPALQCVDLVTQRADYSLICMVRYHTFRPVSSAQKPKTHSKKTIIFRRVLVQFDIVRKKLSWYTKDSIRKYLLRRPRGSQAIFFDSL